MAARQPTVTVRIDGKEQFTDAIESGYRCGLDVGGERVEIEVDY